MRESSLSKQESSLAIQAASFCVPGRRELIHRYWREWLGCSYIADYPRMAKEDVRKLAHSQKVVGRGLG